MIDRPLRFFTFLAPAMFDVYAYVATHIGRRLGLSTSLTVGDDYRQVGEHADVCFVCGLAYVELADRHDCPVEPIAAPVLRGERYGGRPVYYSDVVVRHDSPFRSFADLRGRSWCYNECLSQSGYGITRYRLVELGETCGYFGHVVEAGWHDHSLRLVATGAVDASAIDSHTLALAMRDNPALAGRLRAIDTFGPSTIQPVVVSRLLPAPLRAALRDAFLALAADPLACRELARGLVERFVAVTDRDYDDLRRMRAACERANFLALR